MDICTQITQLLDLKSKQLINDKQSLNMDMFEIEILDEDKIISDFKRVIKSNLSSTIKQTGSKSTDTSSTTQIVTKAMSKYVSNETKPTTTNQKYRLIAKTKQEISQTTTSTGLKKPASNYQLPDRRAKKTRLDDNKLSTTTTTTTINTTSLNFRSKRFKQSTTVNKHQTQQQTNQKKRHAHSSPSSQSSLSSYDDPKLILNEDTDSLQSSVSQLGISTNNNNNNRLEATVLSSTVNQSLSTTTITTVQNNNSQISTTTTTAASSTSNEPVYCICQQISYGNMIGCDNVDCKLEWFHFNCVNLTSKPKGKWYCPQCRGDSHKVMKKNLLKS